MKEAVSSLFVLSRRLPRSLLVLVVCIAIVAITHRAAGEAAQREAREMERRAILRGENEAGANGALLLESGKAHYRGMTERGMIGPEHRFEWTQRISQIKEARRLPELEFELAPQQAAGEIPTLPAYAGPYEFRSSAMKLHMGVRHEGELLDFLDDLGQSVSAMLRVRGCRIGPAAESMNPEMPLVADCTIDWITLGGKP